MADEEGQRTRASNVESALRESEERFRSIVENAPVPILVHTLDGEIIAVSKGFTAISGWTIDDVPTGLDWLHKGRGLVTPEALAEEQQRYEEMFKRGPPYVIEDVEVFTKDGRRRYWTFSAGEPLRMPDGRFFLASMASDMTVRREAEDKINRLNDELEERVRERTATLEAMNKELEAFSYSVSHDLRGPLRAINGFTEILAEDHAHELSGEARGYLDRIASSTRQMGRLVDDLLVLARVGQQAIRYEPINVAALVSECFQELKQELKGDQQDRQVDFEIAALPNAEAERSLLKQVWLNLISNALKYTRRCDVARIRVGFSHPPDHPPEQRGNGIHGAYFIHDNGAGFDMTRAPKLFEPFERFHLAKDYEGTGVGLAIVRRIVERHRGRIWAMSAPEQGATFSFTLNEKPVRRPSAIR